MIHDALPAVVVYSEYTIVYSRVNGVKSILKSIHQSVLNYSIVSRVYSRVYSIVNSSILFANSILLSLIKSGSILFSILLVCQEYTPEYTIFKYNVGVYYMFTPSILPV